MKPNKNKGRNQGRNRLFPGILLFLVFILLLQPVSCAPALRLGRYFDDSCLKVKEGYHTKQDVIRIMGEPYSRETDPQGRRIFVYFWADGRGGGRKCLIVFNNKAEVMLKELVP